MNEPDIYTGSGNNIITAGGTFKAGRLRVTAALEHNITKQKNSLVFGLSRTTGQIDRWHELIVTL